MKRVLMIAYHYPPQHGSSGVLRTLKFSQYLPSLGWQPTVLSAHPRSYPLRSDEQLAKIPSSVAVHRAFALDAAQHLSVRGKYLGITAIPDRWSSWWLGAVPIGLDLIRKHRPDVIWSTYPIPTAHAIAGTLHRLSGIPWIADFRDPMIEDSHPRPGLYRNVRLLIDRNVINHCTRAIFTTPGAAESYRRRYPDVPASRFAVIENGYDESDFMHIPTTIERKTDKPACFTLLHSGIVYASERDPRPLFQALAELKLAGIIVPGKFRLALRAAHQDAYLGTLLDQYDLKDIVQVLPPIPYKDALEEMTNADGLLLLQAENCNNQIPAKLYEYLRVQRPILALTHPAGDTARTLKRFGVQHIGRIDCKDDIKRLLGDFMLLVSTGRVIPVSRSDIASASRESRTAELAMIMNEIVSA